VNVSRAIATAGNAMAGDPAEHIAEAARDWSRRLPVVV
jgi:hypothetical protein